jgi:hypothetical protein
VPSEYYGIWRGQTDGWIAGDVHIDTVGVETMSGYQIFEAGVRQIHEWADPEPQRHILIAVARYLAAHLPTERAWLQTADVAARHHAATRFTRMHEVQIRAATNGRSVAKGGCCLYLDEAERRRAQTAGAGPGPLRKGVSRR